MHRYSSTICSESEAQRGYMPLDMSTQLREAGFIHFMDSFNKSMVVKCMDFRVQLPGLALANPLESWLCYFLLWARFLTTLSLTSLISEIRITVVLRTASYMT